MRRQSGGQSTQNTSYLSTSLPIPSTTANTGLIPIVSTPLPSTSINTGILSNASSGHIPHDFQFRPPNIPSMTNSTVSQSRSPKECCVCRRVQDRSHFMTVHSRAEAQELDLMFGSQVLSTLLRAPSVYVCTDHVSDVYENREKIEVAVKRRERLSTSTTFH